jgi:hypothetical protein
MSGKSKFAFAEDQHLALVTGNETISIVRVK